MGAAEAGGVSAVGKYAEQLIRELGAAERECDRLREALSEACDWLDEDLADPGVPDGVRVADRELVAGWRAVLEGRP